MPDWLLYHLSAISLEKNFLSQGLPLHHCLDLTHVCVNGVSFNQSTQVLPSAAAVVVLLGEWSNSHTICTVYHLGRYSFGCDAVCEG